MLTELIKRFEAAISSAARKIAKTANALTKIAEQAEQSTLSAAELAEAIYYKAVDGADEVISEITSWQKNGTAAQNARKYK